MTKILMTEEQRESMLKTMDGHLDALSGIVNKVSEVCERNKKRPKDIIDLIQVLCCPEESLDKKSRKSLERIINEYYDSLPEKSKGIDKRQSIVDRCVEELSQYEIRDIEKLKDLLDIVTYNVDCFNKASDVYDKMPKSMRTGDKLEDVINYLAMIIF